MLCPVKKELQMQSSLVDQLVQVEKQMKRKYERDKSTRMITRMTRNLKIVRQTCRSLLSKRNEMAEFVIAKINRIELEAL